MTDLLGRQVHRHDERWIDARVLGPQPVLTSHFGEHPRPQGHDQPGLLGERHEVTGRDDPAFGMLPAEERLDADVADLGERHDGLVVDAELAALQRPVHRALGPVSYTHLTLPTIYS